jgi:hypothetical protein
VHRRSKARRRTQLYAGLVKKGVTLDTINKRNSARRFARDYLDEKDPRIEMDVDLDHGGMSSALFEAKLAT